MQLVLRNLSSMQWLVETDLQGISTEKNLNIEKTVSTSQNCPT